MNKRIAIVLFTLGILPSCSSSQPPPLETCILGYWTTSTAKCSYCSDQPECGKDDCQELGIVGYTKDGQEVDGIVHFSASLGSASSLDAFASKPYHLDHGKMFLGSSKQGQDVSCDGTSVTEGFTVEKQAPSTLSSILDATVGQGKMSFQSAKP